MLKPLDTDVLYTVKSYRKWLPSRDVSIYLISLVGVGMAEAGLLLIKSPAAKSKTTIKIFPCIFISKPHFT